MQTVTVAQAKAHFSEILSQVEAGETVIITKRGKAVATIKTTKKTLKPLNLKSLAHFRATMPKLKTPSLKILRKLRDEKY